MLRIRSLIAVAVCSVLAHSSLVLAQPTGSEPSALAADWPLEEVTLRDGTVYQGLVLTESDSTVEFLTVHRPRGKPMYLIVRPLAREQVEGLKRLAVDEQEQLRERLERFRRRTLVQGRRMDDLALRDVRHGDESTWTYQSRWFSLESTANEQTTRRLIVRLGQIFTAYRQLVPPRVEGSERVHIRVFGSMQQYQAALEGFGLSIRNPAVYLVDRNTILAGSELDSFDAQLAKVDRQHDEIRKQLDSQLAQLPGRIKKLGEDLKAADVPTAERLRILLAEQRKLGEQRRDVLAKIVAIDRLNEAKFNELTSRMFTRVAHEAFHAYLETYVYPSRDYDVPRWLNEGLAEVFEAGLLEADSLRIDAPNVVALQRLKRDLRGGQPLRLRELLNSGSTVFLSAHDRGGETSRAYYYSWGLAYYLAFERGILDDPAFDDYLAPEAARLDPVSRFEALIGMPLEQFEQRWHKAMFELTPAA